MGNNTEFFKNQGGEVINASASAVKVCLFVTVAAVALGVGIGVVQGGFSS